MHYYLSVREGVKKRVSNGPVSNVLSPPKKAKPVFTDYFERKKNLVLKEKYFQV